MSRQHNYFVYISTNPRKSVLYIGVTNDLLTRLKQHYDNRGNTHSFAGEYYCYNLLFYERFQYVQHAIDREKEIKKLSRKEKETLIGEQNAEWAFITIND